MILKYLKDQGGQFWGAFSQSLAQAAERERDRPLKEAMMKAELGQKQAQMQKMIFDMNQAKEQAAAVQELGSMLQTPQPTTVQLPSTSLPNEAAGETGEGAQVTQMKTPELTDPRIRAQLLKSGVKGEVLSQMAKSAFPTAGSSGMTVSSWDDAVAVQNTEAFKQANPYGGRWVQTKNGYMFQGIHPVSPEAAIFHGGGGTAGAIDYAFQRGASSAAGGQAGRTAQEIGQPIPQRVPFAGQPQQGAPASQGGWQGNVAPTQQPSTSTAPLPNETPEMTKQRLRKQAQVGATPPTQAQTDAIDAMTATIGSIDQLFKNFPEKEIEGLSGWSRFGQSLNQMGIEADKILGTKMGSKEQSQRFSQYKNLVGMLKKTAFALGGKQLTPFEASVVFQSTPTDDDYSVDLIQKAKTLRDFTKASRAIRQRLMKEGRANISMEELDSIMTQELGSRFAPGGQQQGGLPPPPVGWK